MFKVPFRRTQRDHSIPDNLWTQVIKYLPWFSRLKLNEQKRLRSLTGEFLAIKTIQAAPGLLLTDEIRISIATQACLLILELDLNYYKGWEEIIVYPGEFVVPREEPDEPDVIHEYLDIIAGEAWDHGPVILSWNVSDISVLNPSFNIVIHEFAHKIDLRNGAADGIPPFSRILHPHLNATLWQEIIHDSYEDFVAQVEKIERSIPIYINPHSEQASPYYQSLPMDSYAAEDTSEFFSVCSEAFFITPTTLQHGYPHVYKLLAQFYRQDPLAQTST